MRLASFVELVPTYGKLFLPTGGASCNKLRSRCSNTLCSTSTLSWGQGYFSSLDHHYFAINTFGGKTTNSNTNITAIYNSPVSNNKSLHTGRYDENNNNNNKRRRERTTATSCTFIQTRSCICGGNSFRVRNFSTHSSFTGSGRNINMAKEIGKELQFETPIEFMEQKHGVKPGKYMNFLLGMTRLEEDANVFRGNPLYVYPKRNFAFGGSLLGQALKAAVCSVTDDFFVHSLHNYFLNAGQQGNVDYHVVNVRDGNTYCNRFVKAMQNGKNIVNMQVSFKKNETDPFQHQQTMPKCKRPEELESATKVMEAKLSENLSEDLKKTLKQRLGIDPVVEFRPVDPEALYRLKPMPPRRLTWVKIIEKLDDDENIHCCAAAYLSDYIIITTSLLPNEKSSQKFFVTSLDHSIWFHNKFRVDDWLLYETESCYTGGGIGFATGRFWTQDGLLAASVAQQGVVRSLL